MYPVTVYCDIPKRHKSVFKHTGNDFVNQKFNGTYLFNISDIVGSKIREKKSDCEKVLQKK